LAESRARDFDVVERERPIADDLVLLVPFARDEHQIAGTGGPNRKFDGRPPVGIRDESRSVPRRPAGLGRR
jgi:hypothetical protein